MRGSCGVSGVNKEEAAKELGCSTRQVEKLASEGRLGDVLYVRGKRGRQADYNPAEVGRLKAELEASRSEVIGHAAPVALAPRVPAPLAQPEAMRQFAEMIAEAVRGDGRAPLSDVAAKLVLKLDEASRLTGLSRGTLRAAIDGGQLRAKIVGRAWRIKRADLDSFIKRL
jgi:excisionase family DNA binding protein